MSRPYAPHQGVTSPLRGSPYRVRSGNLRLERAARCQFLQWAILQSGRIRSAYTSIPQGYTSFHHLLFHRKQENCPGFYPRRTHSPPSKGCTLCAGCSRYGACSGRGEIRTRMPYRRRLQRRGLSSYPILSRCRTCTTVPHYLFSCQPSLESWGHIHGP